MVDIKKYALILPVYNDWQSLQSLLLQLDQEMHLQPFNISVFVINDHSSEILDTANLPSLKILESIEIVNLVNNLGHQKALCIGLCAVYEKNVFDAVILADADGEDKAGDIPKIINFHLNNPNKVIVAKRRMRKEGPLFKIGYFLYKRIFKVATGKVIDFGNFSLIPQQYLEVLVAMPELWSHIPGTLIRSKVELMKVSFDRGERLAGLSKMNYSALVMHGLAGVTVFIDIALTRLLLSLSMVIITVLFLSSIVISIKFFTNMAIPGWTTISLGLLILLLSQCIMLAIIALFTILSQKSLTLNIPKLYFYSFISSNKNIYTQKKC